MVKLSEITVTGWHDLPERLPCPLSKRRPDGGFFRDSDGKSRPCPGIMHLQPAEPFLDWHEAEYRCDECKRHWLPFYFRDGFGKKDMDRFKEDLKKSGAL